MTTSKLTAGAVFPQITMPRLGGGELELGVPKNGADWQLVVVYRGRHCPLCTKYLAKVHEAGIEAILDEMEKESRAFNSEMVAMRFELKDQLTREEWEALFSNAE